MLFRKLWRTMAQYKAQFISMIIMTALGIGVFVGFNMEWVSIEKNIGYFFEQTGFADYRIISENGFSTADVNEIAAINSVEAVSRFISVNADVKEYDGDSVALTVSENQKVSGFMLTDGAEYDKNSKDGVWLSDKYADANGIKLGDRLTFTYKNIEFNCTVAGFVKSSEYMICVRDETQMMPDYDTYGFAYISPKMYEGTVGTAYYPQLNVLSELDKKDFTAQADKAIGRTEMILTKDDTVSYAEAKGEAEEGKTMGSVIPVLFLLISVLTMVTTMHRLTAQEKTQIGTLKALGFRDRRIVRHYTCYAVMIGVIGSALGVGLGYLIGWYIMNPDGMMGTYLDMPRWKLYLPLFCVVIIVAIILLMTFIGYLAVRKMLMGTAADALRAYTPKKMKSLLVEKTALFHKLPFGIRWNMRDIMRHKSRSAMSLLGILGCTVITVCAMGMNDTMNAYLDVYYNGAINYSSRIYLSEDATQQQRSEIADRYNGDTGQTIGVQIGDQSVTLDIYDVSKNMVRFPDEDYGYADLSDDGAFICVRLADEYDLSAGDSFTLSPYGTDKEYLLTVRGVIRSVSKTVTVSRAYAEKLGITYTPDSVYTATDKDGITPSPAIKGVQSKQKIMDSFDTFVSIMNMSIIILIIAAVVLAFVVLYNLGVMSYTERYREMATLKVVGFRDRKIGHLLIQQNMWVTAIGIIAGIPLGALTLDYLMVKLAGEYEMSVVIGPMTYIVGVVATFLTSLAVSAAVSRKNKKIDMVEALKGTE